MAVALAATVACRSFRALVRLLICSLSPMPAAGEEVAAAKDGDNGGCGGCGGLCAAAVWDGEDERGDENRLERDTRLSQVVKGVMT